MESLRKFQEDVLDNSEQAALSSEEEQELRKRIRGSLGNKLTQAQKLDLEDFLVKYSSVWGFPNQELSG